ncbi:MAG: hypothetical protein RI897_1486 [Verrucomicrobiota bacterium]
MVEEDKCSRDHVMGQAGGEVGGEFDGGGMVGVGGSEVGDESWVAVVGSFEEDDCGGDLGVVEEVGFDFGEFDSEAVQFDLGIGAAEECEAAIGG